MELIDPIEKFCRVLNPTMELKHVAHKIDGLISVLFHVQTKSNFEPKPPKSVVKLQVDFFIGTHIHKINIDETGPPVACRYV